MKKISIPLIRNNEVSITQEEWIELNNSYSITEIIQLLSDTIGKVELPLKRITEEDALCDFKKLQSLDASSLVQNGETFTKRDYKWGLTNTYIGMSNIGNVSSNYFHQDARFRCNSLNSPSPHRVWNTEKFRMNMLKNLWSMKTIEVNSDRLRQAMSLRNYVASQFKPSAAKALYEHFNSKKVLDFCGGWGDRLAGFSSCKNTELYVGVDPNSSLHPQYKKQVELYDTGKNYKFFQSCAEDMVYEDTFDTIFTSPPYFDIERYSDEDSQSWKRYKGDVTISEKTATNPRIAIPKAWLEGFLYESIKRAWGALEPDGILAVNIADVYGHHAWQSICDPMNDYISTLPNSQYQGAIGYRMAKRPNSLVDEWKTEFITTKPSVGKVYVEPIWIWKKSLDTRR